MPLIREFCAEGFGRIAEAVQAGVDRIELCEDLRVGGVTPSAAVMAAAVSYCAQHGQVPVMVLIRPHARSFVYSEEDVADMCASIAEARQHGAAGVVLGALTEEGKIDRVAMGSLLEAARGLQVTFHMAFDAIVPLAAQRETELPWLRAQAEAGRLHRVLTHGSAFHPGAPAVPIEEAIPYLKLLVAEAGPALRVLPGGGITADNAEFVAHALGVTEVHGTKIVKL